MKIGQIVRINSAESVKSHFGIIVDIIGTDAAFLKVPCKPDRENAPLGLILLGADYLTTI